MRRFTFAHLTDLHLPIPVAPTFGELMGKRALGYLSWVRRRRFWHQPEVAKTLVQDMRSMGCEAALLSGDVVNISTEAEFAAARTWLGDAFAGLPLILCPGNHDAYVRTPWETSLGRLGPFMVGRRGQSEPRPPRNAADFPFRVDLGADLAVIAANSAPPTAPALATGALGAGQIAAIKDAVDAAAGKFVVLMLHHPVTDDVVSRRKALDDRAALRAALAQARVDLVLHGHAHVAHFGEIETAAGRTPVVGGAALSHTKAHGKYAAGRYNLFTLEADGDRLRLDLAVREFDPASGGVLTVDTRVFERSRSSGFGDAARAETRIST